MPSGQKFFSFCEELLIKYKEDNRVWHIDGTTFQENASQYSYEFSKYCLIWGWATWRRAWFSYDSQIKKFPLFKSSEVIKSIWNEPTVRKYWLNNFEEVYNGNIDTWDFQWMFAMWINNGISIRPTINMMKNIGFDADATHTLVRDALYESMENSETDFPLIHPDFFLPNIALDDVCSLDRFKIKGPVTAFLTSIKIKLKKMLSH